MPREPRGSVPFDLLREHQNIVVPASAGIVAGHVIGDAPIAAFAPAVSGSSAR